ncbi:STAS domain-containing protein [Roseomonas elaeocarpi]|uniref:STAS domain-containing protein n=1 Tax=Roseomonas elaeocarpi TaxID=907779 RepID=A0ABV6JS52_9PROT
MPLSSDSDFSATGIPAILAEGEAELTRAWNEANAALISDGRIGRGELLTQCTDLLHALQQAVASGRSDVNGSAYTPVRDLLGDLSRSRALQGFSATETASFVFSLKEPLFALLRRHHGDQGSALAEATGAASRLIDALGLYTIGVFQRSREEIIVRQQQELQELSTPVVKLWDGILALPLIGTLDSTRTQVVMENLLQAIVDHEAEIAIVDITGVPTVDTLVAQHLLKTISAARLMGADCIVSGIRPQIAQTMVHLGVELNVVSKATLADAFALALTRLGRRVVRSRPGTTPSTPGASPGSADRAA